MTDVNKDDIIGLYPGYYNFLRAWFRINPNEFDVPTQNEWETTLDDIERYKPKNFNPTELLDAFGPECLAIIKRNIRELHQEKGEAEKALSALLDFLLEQIHLSDAVNKECQVKDACHLFYDRPLQEFDKHISRLNHLLKIEEWKRKPKEQDGQITDQDIARAKEYPLKDLVQLNRAGFTACPFHNEKTPSLKIFPDNRFHCFGCGADGDAIDFIMKLHRLEFIPAVKKILGK